MFGRILIAIFLSTVVATAAFARTCADALSFVDIEANAWGKRGWIDFEGRKIYYEHIPAKPGRKTVVVMNGLMVPLIQMSHFKRAFFEQGGGEGMLFFSYSTQFESIGGARGEPNALLEKASLDSYSQEAEAVLRTLRVRGPLAIVGYSFGSAPTAQWLANLAEGQSTIRNLRERITDVVFVVPMVRFDEGAAGTWMRVQALQRTMATFGAYQIINDMRPLIDAYGKPDIGQVQKGIVDTILSTDGFDLREELLRSGAAWPRTSLIIAGNEDPDRKRNQHDFAAQGKVVRPSRRMIQTTEIDDLDHRALTDRPDEVARVLLKSLNRR